MNGAQFDQAPESSRRIVHQMGSLFSQQASKEVNHRDNQILTDSAKAVTSLVGQQQLSQSTKKTYKQIQSRCHALLGSMKSK